MQSTYMSHRRRRSTAEASNQAYKMLRELGWTRDRVMEETGVSRSTADRLIKRIEEETGRPLETAVINIGAPKEIKIASRPERDPFTPVTRMEVSRTNVSVNEALDAIVMALSGIENMGAENVTFHFSVTGFKREE